MNSLYTAGGFVLGVSSLGLYNQTSMWGWGVLIGVAVVVFAGIMETIERHGGFK